jgi:hypothetical protein
MFLKEMTNEELKDRAKNLRIRIGAIEDMERGLKILLETVKPTMEKVALEIDKEITMRWAAQPEVREWLDKKKNHE